MINLKEKSILMISLDPGLLEIKGAGNALARHKDYAKFVKRLDIFLFSKFGYQEKVVTENFTVHAFPNSFAGYIEAKKKATKLFASHNYELVDAQDPHMTGKLGLEFKKKYGCKLEVHFHGDFWNNPHWKKESFKNIYYNFLHKKIVSQADAIRVVNQRIKDKLLKAGVPDNKIEVINTPVNEEAFSEIKHSEIEGEKNILFVGRLVAAKNLFFTLEVVKKLSDKRKDFKLLIVGDGELKDQLADKINKLKINKYVSMEGPKNQNELLDYYSKAYLSILLSTNESLGKVIIESGFAEVPTIASRAIGPSEVIDENKNGWLVEINDLDQTVNKLDELLSDEERVRKVGQQAKNDFSDKYSQAATYEKIKNFWIKILS